MTSPGTAKTIRLLHTKNKAIPRAIIPFPRQVRAFVPAGPRISAKELPPLNNRADATSVMIIEGNGTVLRHVQLYLVFWGSEWAANPEPSKDDVTNAAIRILYSPYMSGLAQYHGIGGGRFAGAQTITSTDPPAPFSDGDIQNFLIQQLDANVLPRPSSNNQYFFSVFLPKGLVAKNTDFIGEHNSFTRFGFTIPYAWIMNDGTLDYVTTIFSHELVEACSDPNLNAIIVKGGPGSACPTDEGANCEIGDVCSSTQVVSGVRVQSYWSAEDNQCIVPQNIISGEVAGNPVIIQGKFLSPGNFELVSPLVSGGMAHYSRVNSMDFVPWFGPETFAQNVGTPDALSMIQSNFTTGPNIGNLELVALFQGGLLYYWREDLPPYLWHGPVPMVNFEQRLFEGNPVLIQGRFEHRGNFELVVPLTDGGLAHYSRANDLPEVPWFGPNIFAKDLGVIDAISMIQSNWTVGPNIGLLEVAARLGSDLVFYSREDAPPFQWFGPLPQKGFEQREFTGNPVLIRSRFGSVGNFEVIVPLAAGGLAHYVRNNDDPSRPWFGPNVFGEDVGVFDEISFIQSDFTAGAEIGNFELVARVGSTLLFYWRDDITPFTWYGPRVVVT